MFKIGVFLPSYNRPSQLRLLLESIAKNTKDIFDHIHIHYLGTTPDFAAGYSKLIQENILDNISWHPKTTLHADMLHTLGNEDYEYITIITDDSVFYRPLNLNKEQIHASFIDEINHFTFRCGINTAVIDYLQPELIDEFNSLGIGNDMIVWNWTQHNNHYGYPCALDASLFNREYLLWFTQNALPEQWDYRKWECDCHQFLIRNHGSHKLAIGTTISSVVNIPCNMVSDGPYCKNGEQFAYSAEDLNNKYLNDEVIDLAHMDFSHIISVQQELPFVFRNLND